MKGRIAMATKVAIEFIFTKRESVGESTDVVNIAGRAEVRRGEEENGI